MSQSNPNNTHFSSPKTLSEWLNPRLPSESFASWGVKPGTKNVHNLWLELSQGESLLDDSIPPIRTVHIITIRVMDKIGRTLLESHQELSDGTVRSRCRPLSEKIKPGETYECAALRAIKEELGLIIDGSCSNCLEEGGVRILSGSYQYSVEEKDSVSYPGLPACYVLHSVDACVFGLPEVEFCTEENEEYGACDDLKISNEAIFVRKHFWKWVDSDFAV